MEVLEMPDRISKAVLDRGVDAQTAFEIVSIDIADIDVGQNVGLVSKPTRPRPTRMSRRLSPSSGEPKPLPKQQEMKAKVTENRARLVLAEAGVPMAIASAFRNGKLHQTSCEEVI